MKSLTSSEQESQSDSKSKDTRVTETSESKLIVRRRSLKFYENGGKVENNSSAEPTYGYFTTQKGKTKRSPSSPPLTVGDVGVKRPRK